MKSIAIAITFAALALLMSLDIQAAPPPAPTPISDNCEEIANIGIIQYYFCETNYGDFFTNSFGFMLPE
jgi:hypothetical protein